MPGSAHSGTVTAITPIVAPQLLLRDQNLRSSTARDENPAQLIGMWSRAGEFRLVAVSDCCVSQV